MNGKDMIVHRLTEMCQQQAALTATLLSNSQQANSSIFPQKTLPVQCFQ